MMEVELKPLANKFPNDKPWWRDDNPQTIAQNPALMTGLERVTAVHMRQWFKAMDEVVPEDIADNIRRFCERYAGTAEFPMAVAVARELKMA